MEHSGVHLEHSGVHLSIVEYMWSIVEYIWSSLEHSGAHWEHCSLLEFIGDLGLSEFDGALEYTEHVECLGVQEHYGVIRRSCFSQPE